MGKLILLLALIGNVATAAQQTAPKTAAVALKPAPSPTPSASAVKLPVLPPKVNQVASPTKPSLPKPPPPPPDPTVCAGALTSGVDVSDHQLSTDWQETKKAGWQFAFVKATQGIDFVNVSFTVDWKNAKDAGLVRGAYHFFMPTDDPTAQAKFYLETVGPADPSDLPPLFDWEYPSTQKPEITIAAAKVWLQTVEAATGKTPIIYTYPAYWKSLGSPAGFEKYPLFIADDTGNCPAVPAPWKTWMFWQHGMGAVQGVVEPTDLDFFNGEI